MSIKVSALQAELKEANEKLAMFRDSIESLWKANGLLINESLKMRKVVGPIYVRLGK